jgi:ketosteroid isomerase-like protein
MDNKALAQQIFDACMAKDEAKIRELVAQDYKLKDPMMTVEGVDGLIEMIRNCPNDGGRMQNIDLIAEGDRVACSFEMANDKGESMRMCSFMTFKNGKLASEEMFYDTAQIPQEYRDQMKQNAA